MRRFSPLVAIAAAALCAGCGSGDEAQEGFSGGGGSGDGDTGTDVRPDAFDAAPDRPPDAPVEGALGPPYPFVLLHGFGGFSEIQKLKLHYYNGVAADLAANGEPLVFESEASPFLPPEERAKQIAVFVDGVIAQTGKAKVNLVGHSQGGLDARWLVSALGYGDRVSSVTSIATPHRGTRVADAVLKIAPDWSYDVLDAFAKFIGKTYNDLGTDADLKKSLTWLSEDYVQNTFNPKAPDDARVAYFSYTGRSNGHDGVPDCNGSFLPDDPSKVDAVDPLLAATGAYLTNNGGGPKRANDGLLTVESARWGTFMGCVPADHLDEVGQIADSGPDPKSGFDHLQFYRDLVARLRKLGH